MRRVVAIAAVLPMLVVAGCRQPLANTAGEAKSAALSRPDASEGRESTDSQTLLFFEDFDKCEDGAVLPSTWWAEGTDQVRVEKGYLRTNANPGQEEKFLNASVVWINRVFAGDIKLVVDAHILSAKDNATDIVVFFLFSDPKGVPLFDTRETRKDSPWNVYKQELNGYMLINYADMVDGMRTMKPATFRLYDSPGGHAIKDARAGECEVGKTYHIVITKVGSRLTFAVDGTVCLEAEDTIGNPEHTEGYIGFRTWQNDIWWDNVSITRLAK